jgi:carbon-monoxide dehydrogenase large subunit
MEPRACLARYDEGTGDLTLWVTSQNPHVHGLLMAAFVLGIPEHKIRVIAPVRATTHETRETAGAPP